MKFYCLNYLTMVKVDILKNFSIEMNLLLNRKYNFLGGNNEK